MVTVYVSGDLALISLLSHVGRCPTHHYASAAGEGPLSCSAVLYSSDGCKANILQLLVHNDSLRGPWSLLHEGTKREAHAHATASTHPRPPCSAYNRCCKLAVTKPPSF
eukprot:867890-Prorocentrum_minimum.AAC.3